MCGNECLECGIIEAETLDQAKFINRIHQAEILYLMLQLGGYKGLWLVYWNKNWKLVCSK